MAEGAHSDERSSLFIDRSAGALTVFTFSGGPVLHADWQALLSEVDTIVRRDAPFGLIFDARRGVTLGATQRREAAEVLRRYERPFRTRCRGLATVSSSTIVRGLITAVRWVFPAPCPDLIESDLEVARRWVEERLRNA